MDLTFKTIKSDKSAENTIAEESEPQKALTEQKENKQTLFSDQSEVQTAVKTRKLQVDDESNVLSARQNNNDEVDFESSLNPSLHQLFQPNWYSRPKTSSVYKSSRRNQYQSGNTLASTATKVESLSRNILSGRPDLRPSVDNKDIFKQVASVTSSQDIPFSLTSSQVNVSSPRKVGQGLLKTKSRQPKGVARIDEDSELGSKRSVAGRRGTLKEIYESKKLQYRPQMDKATPNPLDTAETNRIDVRERNKRAQRACFSNETHEMQREKSAHRMSRGFLQTTKIGAASKDRSKAKFNGPLSERNNYMGMDDESTQQKKENQFSPRQFKQQMYEDMVTFENLLKSQGDKNDQCRNGLKIRHHRADYQNIFSDEVEDFEDDIKQLEK